ncbi:hypothetical protein DYBT9275_05702 [Dyadobacter sp. CECT 9275]|uniref:HTH luxR-type domain-containing protein n=1 Tax=Dyadobacter helix TaxID=2822344 RepID=A0A916JHY7_9BACT|nr:tetratricopeptide repeat protein [Dyadobacter sp. CECT 9275]CAG5017108.1 hypothetical protein DYBT9275_05702 [Dyadobacter sp. CECT 9275]
MKISISLLFLLFTAPVFAQSSKIDSLENLLRKSSEDTSRVNLLVDLAMEYWASAPENTIHYSEKALQLAQKLNYLRGQARSYQGIAVYHWQKSDYISSIATYKKGKKTYEQIGDKAGIAKILSGMGLVYGEQGNYTEALDHYLQAVAIFRELGYQSGIAGTLNSIGNVHKNQKNFEEALASYTQAMAIWTKTGDQKSMAGYYINAGSIYCKQKKYPEAIASANKAVGIFEKLKDSNGQIICHNNLGETYFQQKDYTHALAEYQKALEINEQYQSKKLMISSYNGRGNVLAALNRFSESVDSYKKAADLAVGMGLRPQLQRSYEGLATVYGSNKDYSNAFHYQKLAATLKDSIFNAENANKIANLRVHYETEQKEIEIKLLEKEKDLGYATRNTVALGLAAGLILVVLAFNRQRLKVQKENELHQIQKVLAETELRNQKERELQLQTELEFRNKALTTHTLNLIQKNSILEEIRQTVSLALKSGQKDENTPMFSRLINLIDYSFNLDKDWDEFKMYFEGVHKDFFSKLKTAYPELSAGELRLCALVRLNLNLKEAATLLNISPDSVKTARHRLRKKLNLPEESNLADYLMSI